MKFIKLFCAVVLFFAAAVSGAPAGSTNILAAPLAAATQKQERHLRHLGPGARLGLAVLRPDGAVAAQWRGDERFPLASTHKALLCAALLHQADIGALNLDEQIRVKRDKAAGYAPITAKFTGRLMSWRRLCVAAVSHSDNAAANLISARLGGPQATTRFLRQIDDKMTRLDRYEPALNSATPGDRRDTTTPLAVSRTLRALLAGPALKPQSRQLLAQWMREDAVAGSLLRAVLPKDWIIADKSGAGDHGTRAIIAAVWPAAEAAQGKAETGVAAQAEAHSATAKVGVTQLEVAPKQAKAAAQAEAATGAPWIIAIYMTQNTLPMAARDKLIAELGKTIFAEIQRQP